MQESDAKEVFTGLMLGDGSISVSSRYSARFIISQTGEGKLEYLRSIKEALAIMGITTLPGYPQVRTRGNAKVSFLQTISTPLLLKEYARWYPNGSKYKEVPCDIELTPLAVAKWFEGDGNSANIQYGAVRTSIACCGFSEESILHLERELHSLGLHPHRYIVRVKRGSGICFYIPQSENNLFMDMIRPHVSDVYSYKLKYREDSPPSTEVVANAESTLTTIWDRHTVYLPSELNTRFMKYLENLKKTFGGRAKNITMRRALSEFLDKEGF